MEMSPSKKGISPKQIERIRELTKQGYSTTKIQRTLSKEGLGLRRQVMLDYIREYRNQPARNNTQIYIPVKYRQEYRGNTFASYGKGVACYGTVNGVSKRVQMSGNGKSLYQAMKLVAKHPPIRKVKFLSISANELIRHPKKYLDTEGDWDERPKVKS
jgi:hypothetical protein